MRLREHVAPQFEEIMNGSNKWAPGIQQIIPKEPTVAFEGTPFIVRQDNLEEDTHYTAYCGQLESEALSRYEFKTLKSLSVTTELAAIKISTTIATLTLTFSTTGDARCLLLSDPDVIPTSQQVMEGNIPSLDTSIIQLPNGGDISTTDATEATAGVPFTVHYESLVPELFIMDSARKLM